MRGRALCCCRNPVANLLQASGEGFDEQLLLAPEMPVEAPMREVEISHQVGDRGTLAATAPEAARGRAHNPVPCRLFVLGRVPHVVNR
jgi:hypothetical protein